MGDGSQLISVKVWVKMDAFQNIELDSLKSKIMIEEILLLHRE